jgi:hypothetical protein
METFRLKPDKSSRILDSMLDETTNELRMARNLERLSRVTEWRSAMIFGQSRII